MGLFRKITVEQMGEERDSEGLIAFIQKATTRKKPDLDQVSDAVRATRILGEIGTAADVENIIQAMAEVNAKSPDRLKSFGIITQAVTKIVERIGVEPLINLLGSEDRTTRSIAASFITREDVATQAVEALKQALLLRGGNSALKSSACQLLFEILGADAAEPLVDVLKEGDRQTQLLIVPTLLAIGKPAKKLLQEVTKIEHCKSAAEMALHGIQQQS